jgi:hypothetical protein
MGRSTNATVPINKTSKIAAMTATGLDKAARVSFTMNFPSMLPRFRRSLYDLPVVSGFVLKREPVIVRRSMTA